MQLEEADPESAADVARRSSPSRLIAASMLLPHSVSTSVTSCRTVQGSKVTLLMQKKAGVIDECWHAWAEAGADLLTLLRKEREKRWLATIIIAPPQPQFLPPEAAAAWSSL